MANDSRSPRKPRDDESNSSKKKGLNGKASGSTASVTGGTDTSGLRRSARETSSRKQMTQSPTSVRKSERLDKRTPTTPEVKKKAETETTTTPLRRSDRGKKHVSASSSGSKESGNGSASSDVKGKREKSQKSDKSLKPLAVETRKVIRNEKQDLELGVRKRKAMNSRSYKAIFKSQRRKVTEDDNEGLTVPDKLPQVNSGSNGDIYEKQCESPQNDSSSDGGSVSKSMEKDQGGSLCSERQGKASVEECVEIASEGVIGVVDSDLKSLDAVKGVEASYSRRKLRFTEGHNASLDKDGSGGSEKSGTVEGTLDDTAGKSPDGGSPNGCSENSGSGDRIILSNSNMHLSKMDTDSSQVITIKETQTSRLNAASSPLSKMNGSNGASSCFEKLRFVEYWVPVQISNMQLEQYCATLLSNTIALSSCSKNDPVGALHDVLVSSRKCCDHPYIVDPLLQGSVIKDLPPEEYLDVGIKASGKLQLLDAILSELNKQKLRVLILFQPISGTGKDPMSVGNILEDFVRQRFGQDSYERVDGIVTTKRRQAALNSFNKDEGRFIFLLEHRACSQSIKLSSVDVIIIFDSDWNPMNDLRALQRITIDAQARLIKIFRLYSYCTVEERILLNADHDLPLDSKLQNLNRSTSDTLLMWGASYLFNKLDEFHSSTMSITSSEQSELYNVVAEILDLISQKCGRKDTTNSVITRVEQSGGTYIKNVNLLGKLKVQLQEREQPSTFWKKLLDGRDPRWKYLSVSTLRKRRRIDYSEESPKKLDFGIEEVAKKQKKMVNGTAPAPFTPVVEGTSELPANIKPQSVPNERLGPIEVQQDARMAEKSLYSILKLDVSRLCQILKLSEEINAMIGRFLKYIIDNHRVNREPASILQAFLISLCWIGASLLNHKIDKKESLGLAKQHLKFSCTDEEAISVYSRLKRLKKMFFSNTESIVEPDSSNDSQRASEKVILVKHGQSEHCEIAKNDSSENLKQVQKKSEKQMFAENYQKEFEELNIKWVDKRNALQSDHRTSRALVRSLHSNLSVRLGKLKDLDNEFTKKMDESKRQWDKDLEDLKTRHLAEARSATTHGLEKEMFSTNKGVGQHELTLHLSSNTKQVENSEACNEVLECLDTVDTGTPPVGPNKENNGADSSGHDMTNAGVLQNYGIPSSGNGNSRACDQQLPADLDVQNDCPQPLSCSIQDEDVHGNKSSSPQVDSPLQPVATGQGGQSNADGHVEERQSPNFPQASGVVDVPSLPGQILPNNLRESQQMVEELTDVSDNIVLRDENHMDAHTLTDAELHIRENQLNHQSLGRPLNSSDNAEPQAADATLHNTSLSGLNSGLNSYINQGSDSQYQVGMPSTAVNSADPLQIELERIHKEMEHVTKFHEDTMLRQKFECEKEIAEAIAQINSKYESKRQETDAEFLLKRKELDANHNKVLMNKVLAYAFRSKCLDLRPSGASGLQYAVPSSFMQQLHQLSMHTAPRPVPMVPSSSAMQQPSLSQHTTRPPLQIVNNSTALFSGGSTRPPPQIIPITPSTGNLRVNSEIRSPAPHLRPFRPSTSPSPSSQMMSSQHAQGSLPAATPPPPSSRPPSPSPPPPLTSLSNQSSASNLDKPSTLPAISSSFPHCPTNHQVPFNLPPIQLSPREISRLHNQHTPDSLPETSSPSHLQALSQPPPPPFLPPLPPLPPPPPPPLFATSSAPELQSAGVASSTHSNLAVTSMMELLMETINHAGETRPRPRPNFSSLPPTDLGSNIESLDLSQFGKKVVYDGPSRSAPSTTVATDVVCLSDDD